ncbi:MAG: CBS domain-containing protein [Candidatus Altiarchaeota archaeon]
MKRVRDAMSHPVITTWEEESLLEAARRMVKHNIGSLVVVKEEKVVGIITERDYLIAMTAENRDLRKMRIMDVMTSSVVTVKPEVNVFEASKIMRDGGFRRLPIMEKENLVGIVTQTDLNLALREETIDELKIKVHELEIFEKMAIGRELKMAELKKKIKELEGNK